MDLIDISGSREAGGLYLVREAIILGFVFLSSLYIAKKAFSG